MKRKKRNVCDACGAQLGLRSARCPLCGADLESREPPPEVDDYQANVRKLREQLKDLRDEGAEAV